MNLTKVLLMCVIVAGVAGVTCIATQKEGRVPLVGYICMWAIAILQIIARLTGV